MKWILPIILLTCWVACDHDTDREPTVFQVDPREPCGLLTPAQVEEALGTPVQVERDVPARDFVTRICSYQTTEPYASVGVVVETNVSRSAFTDRMDRDPANTEVIEGVGDVAYVHGCVSLETLIGTDLVSLSVQHFDTCEDTEVVLRALADQAVGALT